MAKFNFLMLSAFADTSKLLPYSLSARANDLADKVGDGARLKLAGADSTTVDRLVADIADFQSSAAAFEGKTVPPKKLAAVNAGLVQIQKTIDGNLSALNVYEGSIYPHQQVLGDIENLQATLKALAVPDKATALGALVNVALTVQGIEFSPEVYVYELTRHDPNYYRVTWGGQGHLAKFVNVVPQYRLIEAGQILGCCSRAGARSRGRAGRPQCAACRHGRRGRVRRPLRSRLSE